MRMHMRRAHTQSKKHMHANTQDVNKTKPPTVKPQFSDKDKEALAKETGFSSPLQVFSFVRVMSPSFFFLLRRG